MAGERARTFRGRLRRLPPCHYRGLAWVHWTMGLSGRPTAWLAPLHHLGLRERLCHALGREKLLCAAYCLMPDHAHFLLGGLSPQSDQLRAVKMIRRSWNGLLQKAARPVTLERQAHDHVLTDKERSRSSFETVRAYIRENPVPKGLVESWRDWAFSGCLVLGYPDLDSRDDDFMERFWRISHRLIDPDIL